MKRFKEMTNAGAWGLKRRPNGGRFQGERVSSGGFI